MKKHAFLIMVHRKDKVLEALLQLLDDERNDIFIHIDAKATLQMEELKPYMKKSGLYQAKSVRVNWGGYSQIQAELNLLEAAAGPESYVRYHLLSGADLPLKTQDEIHQFFDAYGEKEFVGFCGGIEGCEERVKLYHLFQEKVRRGNRVDEKLNRGFLKAQKILGINRIKKGDIPFRKGLNWFSITDTLAKTVREEKDWIRKTFRNTGCCDELFLQTVIARKNWFDRVYCLDGGDDNAAAMRYIDWNRGTLYVFRSADFEELLHSQMMFARKFDAAVDGEIVEKIYAYLTKKKSDSPME